MADCKVVYQIVFEVEGGVWGDQTEIHGGGVFLTREAAEEWAMWEGTELNHEMGGVKDHRIEEREVITTPFYPDEED